MEANALLDTQVQRLWTTSEVAEYLSVKPSAVRRWVYERRIRYIKIGRLVRFNPKLIAEDAADGKIGVIQLKKQKQLPVI
jgi:excisionase family DNA binding protein